MSFSVAIGLLRFVFGHDGAVQHPNPAARTGLLGRVMDDRALSASRIPVEHRKVLVDVGKGIGHAVGPVEFEQIRPHVIGRPVFDGPNGARRWDGPVSVKVGIHPGVGVHRGFAGGAFIETGAQQK